MAAVWASKQGLRVTKAEIAMVDWLVSTGLEVRTIAFQSPEGIAYAEVAANGDGTVGDRRREHVDEVQPVSATKRDENTETGDQCDKCGRRG